MWNIFKKDKEKQNKLNEEHDKQKHEFAEYIKDLIDRCLKVSNSDHFTVELLHEREKFHTMLRTMNWWPASLSMPKYAENDEGKLYKITFNDFEEDTKYNKYYSFMSSRYAPFSITFDKIDYYI